MSSHKETKADPAVSAMKIVQKQKLRARYSVFPFIRSVAMSF